MQYTAVRDTGTGYRVPVAPMISGDLPQGDVMTQQTPGPGVSYQQLTGPSWVLCVRTDVDTSTPAREQSASGVCTGGDTAPGTSRPDDYRKVLPVCTRATAREAASWRAQHSSSARHTDSASSIDPFPSGASSPSGRVAHGSRGEHPPPSWPAPLASENRTRQGGDCPSGGHEVVYGRGSRSLTGGPDLPLPRSTRRGSTPPWPQKWSTSPRAPPAARWQCRRQTSRGSPLQEGSQPPAPAPTSLRSSAPPTGRPSRPDRALAPPLIVGPTPNSPPGCSESPAEPS